MWQWLLVLCARRLAARGEHERRAGGAHDMIHEATCSRGSSSSITMRG
jgi:hypothetical protein